jgi:heme/copper-type cytochrome/quinol oxidase subunit 2
MCSSIATSKQDDLPMRYFLQFVIPAVIFLGLVYAVTRHRRTANPDNDSGAATFITILVIGAVVAVATILVLLVNWDAL